jgi:hypothetical protein
MLTETEMQTHELLTQRPCQEAGDTFGLVKHQGEPKTWHSKHLDCGRLLHAMI